MAKIRLDPSIDGYLTEESLYTVKDSKTVVSSPTNQLPSCRKRFQARYAGELAACVETTIGYAPWLSERGCLCRGRQLLHLEGDLIGRLSLRIFQAWHGSCEHTMGGNVPAIASVFWRKVLHLSYIIATFSSAEGFQRDRRLSSGMERRELLHR